MFRLAGFCIGVYFMVTAGGHFLGPQSFAVRAALVLAAALAGVALGAVIDISRRPL
jgi:hypothetical protein